MNVLNSLDNNADNDTLNEKEKELEKQFMMNSTGSNHIGRA
jgi:hypothetical protein